MDFNTLFKNEGVTLNKEKGDHVFMQGEVDGSIYYIQSGLLKAYYTSEDGKESVKSFIATNDIIGSLSTALSEKNCSFSLICLEPTTLIKIPISRLIEHSKKDLEIANSMIDVLLNLSIKKEIREYEFLCLSAEERLNKLMQLQPQLIEKVTQNDLARYLGVTPVGLSRIKKRILKG
ncbi:Crp/Fnr family transcriptional regulator [Psychromonas algicola]|uniref:Crp/Fnr family transcriptional regulator n=1 Tax=Psychromonas algicola TaxID=2555642 RepID=UPI0010682D67|nr:Crp/Fnr family transcriptional regulator [Psychromonas sp. RZ5]TEW44073.1 Crp/Fnr family transcriptional regulator [Psychromonas sp. RZ5]